MNMNLLQNGLITRLFLAALCVFQGSAFAAEPPAVELQSRLNAIHSMSAHFNQTVRTARRQVSASSGTMAMQRPGRFRWETKDPMEQLVVADGNKLWIYDVDLEQVTVKRQEKGLGGTPALFLSGYDDTVARDFDVTPCKGAAKTACFDLKAKSSKANFQRLKLVFEGAALSHLDLYDQMGQHTEVRLSAVKSNPDLKSSLFHFSPPRGVDVVRQ